jgi:HD-like signal output (HDOD) protein
MAIQKAQQWIRNHSPIIPALEITYLEISEILEQEHQAHNLVKLSIRDPGLSLALLIKVNKGRSASSTREPVESPQSAISLLGDQATRNVFHDTPVAEKILKTPQQVDAFHQIINRSFHNEIQAECWGKLTGYKHVEPLKLAGLLGYIGELLCCCYDFKRYQKYQASEHSAENQESIFGFQFDELSLAVATKYNLPSLILRSIPLENDSGQRSQLIKYLNLICRFSEINWYSEQMLQIQQEFAEYLKQPLDRVISQIHQNAISAARNSLLPQSWQVACGLILLPDIAKPEVAPVKEPEPVALIEPTQNNYQKVLERIKQLIKQPQTTQSALLNACLHGLHHDLGLTKVNLLLVSKDRQKIHSRLNIGLEPTSPLRHYSIEVKSAGLLKILLNKPQAIWINNSSFSKYQKLIPQSFLASIMTNNFFAMSLFINEKAIGIIYADHTGSSGELNDRLFQYFKQTITLCSKALSLLAKKHKPHTD